MSSDKAPYAQPPLFSSATLPYDLKAGLVVFLVAMPLCLGIALASGAEPFAGLLSGIVGGLVVGTISRSHTSVSGPAAGLTTIVAAQLEGLGTFDAFLLAVFVAGVFQIGLGVIKAGALSAFFPSSVIKGLLAAIGVILILKQIPHVVGHDDDPEGEMAFSQPDNENTFTEILSTINDFHTGAVVVGLLSILLLVIWGKWKPLKNSIIPGPLVVVLVGVAINWLFMQFAPNSRWVIGETHLVQVPIAETTAEWLGFLQMADFSQWTNPAIYLAGATIAIVASLETLLNLEAVDKLDEQRRHSPGSRELIAQGCGNLVCGLIGGLPVTSVVIRGSVNVSCGAKTKLSAIFHGVLMLIAVVAVPWCINMIPLAALAAILLVTGFKLASPKLFKQMWSEGRYQFIPFIVTLLAIVFSDLLIGVVIGLVISTCFILHSNLRAPIRRVIEKHVGGDVLRVDLANQVSFLNRAGLSRVFDEAPQGSHVLIDASQANYIDPDVLSLIRDFRDNKGPARGVTVSMTGFKTKYEIHDDIQFADYTTPETQTLATPDQVVDVLRAGNLRFQEGKPIARNYRRQIDATATGQNPLAVILGCIDSRVPAEIVFDQGIGDVFSCRVAGNIPGSKTLGSLEYAVCVARVKLVLVMGHTGCGAVASAVQAALAGKNVCDVTGCRHLEPISAEINACMEEDGVQPPDSADPASEAVFVNEIARRNVLRTVGVILERSDAIRSAMERGDVKVLGAMYDVGTGELEMLEGEQARVTS